MQQSYLDRLVARANRFLLRWRLQRELRLAAGIALLATFVLPLLLLAWRFVAALVRGPQPPVNWWLVAALAIAGPLIYVAARLLLTWLRHRPARQTGLALFDQQLDTRDRLVTADEFISTGPDDSPFKQAAVEDAEAYVDKALQTQLEALPMPEWRIRPLSWAGVAATVLVAVLLAMQLGSDAGDAGPGGVANTMTAVEARGADEEDLQQRLAMNRQTRRAQQEPQQEAVATELEQQSAAPQRQKSRDQEPAEGQSNAGSASMAQTASQSSSSAGQPSSQKNASKPTPQEELEEEDKRKDRDAKKKKQNRPQESTQLAMESSSGRGRSGASSSTMSEIEMPEQPDKAGMGAKDDDQAEETEDEDEEEKSNAVAKPDLRDRKAPVDRNLSPAVGASQEPRDDLNGRGGPGARKKTRGVPSMILGVPVADRVQGRPNPGRSKVTQENAKPTAESHPALTAEARAARAEATGEIERQPLLPWMADLVRQYFLSSNTNP